MIDLRIRLQNILVVFALAFFAFNSISSAQSISPYKDRDFKHPRVLNSGFGGDYQEIYYNESEHVNGRDSLENPGEQAKPSRVTLIENKYFRLNTKVGGLSTHQLGNVPTANFVVIFIHGAGGRADLGFNDWSFGGNFNRLKNLVLFNGGAYLSPTVKLKRSNASPSVEKMIDAVRAQNQSAKIILTCASAGGKICWDLASSRDYSAKLSGLILLGSAFGMPNNNLPYIQFKKPILFAHGSRDPRLPAQTVYNNFTSLKALSRDYPVKHYLYEGGNHGNPLRMIDWRKGLNWIL
jgi:pimeloyl-ACP methyl ester carboxylesterase